MIGMTMCSGIGAPEIAAPWVDWRFASEIEPFPRAVLQRRFGYLPPADHVQGAPYLHDDMREITPGLLRNRGIPLPDLIVAGTPCQAFSIAGARKGLEDPRGNLTLSFVEIVHAIVDARHNGKLAVLWENVPGVLSDKGNAFGCFLGGLVGALDALPAPERGRWPGEGMVEGPRARLAWATLDAQWFGVAQRRRRVFVVVDFGGCLDPAAVLLEPDSLRGNSAPGREAGEKPAPTISARPTGGGGLGTDFDLDGGLIAQGVALRGRDGGATAELTGSVSPTLRCGGGGGDKPHAIVPPVSMCLNAGAMGRIDGESETFIPVAHSLRGEGFDASEDGTGRGTPIVPVAFDCKAGGKTSFSIGAQAGSLRGEGFGGGHPAVAYATQVYSIMPQNSGMDYKARPVDVAQPLMAGGPVGGNQGGDFVQTSPWAVRRLTPTECARLQGFPDHHTRIEWRGKPADQCPDGHQYKGYGNSMAVPVVRWIMDRMRTSMIEHRRMRESAE